MGVDMDGEAVLRYLEHNEKTSDSGVSPELNGIVDDELVNIIKSLNGFRFVDAQDIKRERWVLTYEGKIFAEDGSPEVQYLLAVPPKGITREELQVQHVDDKVKHVLIKIQNEEVAGCQHGRHQCSEEKKAYCFPKGYSVTKGPKYAPKRTKVATDLTRENLQSFWNFDTLFQPQQRPARDSHDTFFLKESSTTRELPEDYVEQVKRFHESGGYGSRGSAMHIVYSVPSVISNIFLLSVDMGMTGKERKPTRNFYKLRQRLFPPECCMHWQSRKLFLQKATIRQIVFSEMKL